MKNYKNIMKKGIWILYKNKYLCPRMKVKILIGNPEEIEATSKEEVVSQMMKGDFSSITSIQEYMLSYSRRAVQWDNSDIRATDIDSFFEDLLKYNHIQIIKENNLN